MSKLKNPPPLFVRLLMIALIQVALFATSYLIVSAVEIPPASSNFFIQTSGPLAPIGNGDWYTSPLNGVGAGYHYVEINVPCDWPAVTPIMIDLISPEMNSTIPAADEDPNGTPFTTTFELYPPGTTITDPDQPPPGAGIAGSSITYPPLGTPETWERYYTLAAPVTCGTYVLRAQSGDDDENAWRLRVGYDDDNNPATPPNDNPDGVAGTNDEITVGITQISYQHAVAGTAQCLTFYEFVGPNAPEVIFNNFDMDGNVRVTYYAPSDTYDPTGLTGGTPGTLSTQANWNNGGSTTARAGDTIANPEPGWWRIVSCVDADNQFIQEGQAGVAAYLEPPPVPEMQVAKDDGRTGVLPGDVLTYTINFTNTSDTSPNPGAALNVVLVDQVPTNTTYIDCGINAPYDTTGNCIQANGVVTFTLNATVVAGDSGSVWMAVQVNDTATNTVFNTVTLNYEDGIGNPYPPETATDTDIILTNLVDLEINKSDGGVVTVPGGIVVYTLAYSNITATDATGVVITETVPDNTTFNLANSTAGWSCPNDSIAGTICTMTIGALAGNSGGTVDFAVNVADPLPMGVTEIFNIAIIGGNEPETNTDNNSSTDTTPVIPPGEIDLEINKTDGGVTTIPGGTVVYTITYANLSPTTDATGVVITETVPDNTTFNLANSTAGWSCADNSPAGTICTLTIGALPANTGGTADFAVNVADPLPSGVDEISNTVTIGGNEPETNTDNNSSTDATPILYVDPIITKRSDPDEAAAGDLVYFSITVFNPITQSNTAATGVLLIEPMPAQLDLVNYSTASDPDGLVDNVIVDSSETITVDIGVLGLGESVTLNITATMNSSVSGPTTVRNTASLEFNEGSPREDTASVTVPNPNPTPRPGGGNDDDDDDDNPPPPPPAAPQPPPAEPATLPVMFLPETGIGNAETSDWFAFPLLGVMLAIYLWRITKKN